MIPFFWHSFIACNFLFFFLITRPLLSSVSHSNVIVHLPTASKDIAEQSRSLTGCLLMFIIGLLTMQNNLYTLTSIIVRHIILTVSE